MGEGCSLWSRLVMEKTFSLMVPFDVTSNRLGSKYVLIVERAGTQWRSWSDPSTTVCWIASNTHPIDLLPRRRRYPALPQYLVERNRQPFVLGIRHWLFMCRNT
jgi:hypothetical protein